jgi:hypothetical protein
MTAEEAERGMQSQAPPVSPPQMPMAPKLVFLFWTLMGAVAGVTLVQAIWKLAGLTAGAFAIVVPVGAVGGAVGGGLIGRITRPHLLVLVMALLAGWSVGAMSGGLAWSETGTIVGGFLGATVGGLTWTVWWLRERRDKNP